MTHFRLLKKSSLLLYTSFSLTLCPKIVFVSEQVGICQQRHTMPLVSHTKNSMEEKVFIFLPAVTRERDAEKADCFLHRKQVELVVEFHCGETCPPPAAFKKKHTTSKFNARLDELKWFRERRAAPRRVRLLRTFLRF